MPTKTIVDDYIWAAIARARHAWGEHGTLILTVPDFPGVVACGHDIPSAVEELSRLLERWVWMSYERGLVLPVLTTDEGKVDLNTDDARTLIEYHDHSKVSNDEASEQYIGEAEEMEAFVDRFDEGV